MNGRDNTSPPFIHDVTDEVTHWQCENQAVTPTSPYIFYDSVKYGFSGYEGEIIVTDKLYRIMKTYGGIIRLRNDNTLGYSCALGVINDFVNYMPIKKRMGRNPYFSLEVDNLMVATKLKLML